MQPPPPRLGGGVGVWKVYRKSAAITEQLYNPSREVQVVPSLPGMLSTP